MTKTTTTKLQGTCAYCGRRFLTQEGALSAHGFKVSAGWKVWLGYREGSCPAAKMQAFELSPETAELLRGHIRAAITNLKAATKRLEDRPETLTKTVTVQVYPKPERKEYTFRRDDPSSQQVMYNGLMDYEDLRGQEITETTYRLTQCEDEMQRVERMIADWRPCELRKVKR